MRGSRVEWDTVGWDGHEEMAIGVERMK